MRDNLFTTNSGKVCIKCKKYKDFIYFAKTSRTRSGFVARCFECRRKSYRDYYHLNRKRLANYQRNLRKNNLFKARESDKRARNKLRSEILFAYGEKCSCCGESRFAFLTLEHIYHDGKVHRKSFSNYGVYRDLKRRGFPHDRYTLFCWNCNMATRYGSICPHKQSKC